MHTLDHKRLDEIARRYPADPCRQIATYVLDTPDIPEDDHLCAAGILSALDASNHAEHLLIIEVDRASLRAAALADAEHLWGRYGARESNAP